MTLMEALKGSIEFGYQNDDLFNKVFIDQGLTSSATYTKGNRGDIDFCLIEIYNNLLTHPDVKDGKTEIKFDKPSLKAAASRLASQYNLTTTQEIALGLDNTINCDSVW